MVTSSHLMRYQPAAHQLGFSRLRGEGGGDREGGKEDRRSTSPDAVLSLDKLHLSFALPL